MKKSEIVAEVANNVNTIPGIDGVSHKVVEAVIDDFAGLIVEKASQASEISWPSLGKFSGVHQAARVATNPATGGKINVPAKIALKFKPGAAVKREVNGEQ